MKQLIYFYLVNDKKYIDFQVLLMLYENPEGKPLHDRSTLYRYMSKNCKVNNKGGGISTLMLGNKKLFLLEDIFDDVVLLGKMENITLLNIGSLQ